MKYVKSLGQYKKDVVLALIYRHKVSKLLSQKWAMRNSNLDKENEIGSIILVWYSSLHQGGHKMILTKKQTSKIIEW